MPNVVLTIEYGNQHQADLAVPLDVPCRTLSAALVKALKLEIDTGEVFTLTDISKNDYRLPPNGTLGDAGIVHGHFLRLAPEKLKEARAVPQGGAFLITSSGVQINLNGAYTLIGRRDPKRNMFPDLDLSELDTQKITSRKHACIEFDGAKYVITDLGSANGTSVNGAKLTANTPRELKDGDEIVFGKEGIRFTFHRG